MIAYVLTRHGKPVPGTLSERRGDVWAEAYATRSFHRLAWFRRAQVSDFKAEATRHGFKIEKVRVVLDSALLESERLDVEVAESRHERICWVTLSPTERRKALAGRK